MVEPSGPVPCDYAIVGEAPGAEEISRGLGFVGPSGKILWPLVRKSTGLSRHEIYVDNLCLTPLVDESKLTPEEFDACAVSLQGRLERVKPKVVLAVGSLAARALLGSRYHSMEVNNGMTYATEWDYNVVPCWHPAATLHDSGKDTLAWTYDAINHWHSPRFKRTLLMPEPHLWGTVEFSRVIGIDTEGTPEDPICMTLATENDRVYIVPRDVPKVFGYVRSSGALLVYHNAPWDWAVLEAMGVVDPWDVRFADTMELAYLKQTEPQGLKDLALRHFGLDIPTWTELVMPYHDELITAYAKHLVKAATVMKGKREVVLEPEKTLKRALKNPALLRKRLPDYPPPTLRDVPEHIRVDYATRDAWVTRALYMRWSEPWL